MAQIADRNPQTGEVVWRSEEVDEAIEALAPDFYELYQSSFVERGGRRIAPIVLTVMNGGRRFNNDLVATTKRLYPDFNPDRGRVTWSTYWQPTEDGVEPIPILKQGIPRFRIFGRVALVTDDILETGTTTRANEDYLYYYQGAAGVHNIYMLERTNPPKPQLTKAALSAIKTERRAWVIGRDLDDKKLLDDPYWSGVYPDGGRSLDDILVSPNSPHAY